MLIEITRRLEFDMGHRVPSHAGNCRFPHGHRYQVELTVAGPILAATGDSSDGMVTDFGFLKQLLQEEVHDLWDHHFLIWTQDALAQTPFGKQEGVILVPFVPTAELLAGNAGERIQARLASVPDLAYAITRLRLYETPNSWADWTSTLSKEALWT